LPSKVDKVVSGGQTGADRAALDFALENGIDHSGYVPAGRIAEDGPVAAKYGGLTETASTDPAERTRLNVLSSDGTIVVTQGPLAGGTLMTAEYARSMKKPLLHIDLLIDDQETAAAKAREWLRLTECRIVNIAGPRASEDADIYGKVRSFLEVLFGA